MTYHILITGANRGLGLALTGQLLAQGHHLYVVTRRPGEALLDLQGKHSGRLRLYDGDVADEASIQKTLETVAGDTDQLDILLNNAAVHLEQEKHPLLEEADFSVYLPTFLVNAVGPLVVARYALPMLRKGQKRLILNVSSEAGSIGNTQRKSEYAYCMSKSALNMASAILQNALKDEGIKVLAVHPGWFSSDMGGGNAPITPTEAAQDMLKLLYRDWALTDPVYIGPDGQAMPW